MSTGGTSRETSTAGPAKAAAVAVLAAAISAGVTFSVMRRPARFERASEVVYVLPPTPAAPSSASGPPDGPGNSAIEASPTVRAAQERIEKMVPLPVEQSVAPVGAGPKAATPGKINLNTASQAELELLPDVGPKLAKAILEYRKANGTFRCIADLDKVKGIGPQTLKRLASLVTVDGG